MLHPWLTTLSHCPAIAIIRSLRQDWGYQMAVTAIESGLSVIEIAWEGETVTLDLIQHLRQDFPHCSIGVGTILSHNQLKAAIEVGCQFAFSPIFEPSCLHRAEAAGLPFIPGALTPTEIWTAWQAGAIAVKVFPIKSLGGSTYLRCLREALGDQIPLIPTGGVSLENALDLLTTGAIGVGLSGGLFPRLLDGTPDLNQTQTIATQLAQFAKAGSYGGDPWTI